MFRMLFKKIKNALFGFTGTLIYCPYCKGLNVKVVTTSKIKKDKHNWNESYHVECKDCHTKGHINEVWSKK